MAFIRIINKDLLFIRRNSFHAVTHSSDFSQEIMLSRDEIVESFEASSVRNRFILRHSGRTRCSWRESSYSDKELFEIFVTCEFEERLEARNSWRRRVGGRTRRISRLANATAFHQHVILTGQGYRTERNHQKQVRYVGLRALAVNHVAFLRSETTTDERDSCWVRSPDGGLRACLYQWFCSAWIRKHVADITSSIIRCPQEIAKLAIYSYLLHFSQLLQLSKDDFL